MKWRSNSGVRPSRSVSVGPFGTRIEMSVPRQDLLRDEYISNARRMEFEGRSVPSLGGIPLLSKIGQGGMGAVYYGIHSGFAKEVAVKVLPFHLAQRDPTAIQRFFREARLAITVTSDRLVQVIDVAQEDNISYLVMEYVSGKTAGNLVKQAQLNGDVGLPERASLEICIAACEGLAAAHARNVVHRDVKPDNILIPYMPGLTTLNHAGAKVADLGLARNEEHGQSMTRENACLGTPGYMAPEQYEDAHKAGKPADVFGLGATLYMLLCGEAPFRGESVLPIMNETLNKPHKPVRGRRPDISKPTATVIDLCLAKEAGHRYEDAGALLRALRACLNGLTDPQSVHFLDVNAPLLRRESESVQLPAPSPISQPAKFPLLKWLATAAALLCCVGLYFAFSSNAQPGKRYVPSLDPSQMDEDAAARDAELIEKDRVKSQNLFDAEQKMRAMQAGTRQAQENAVREVARKEYDKLIQDAERAMQAQNWTQADTYLEKAKLSPGRTASDQPDAVFTLSAAVKQQLQNAPGH